MNNDTLNIIDAIRSFERPKHIPNEEEWSRDKRKRDRETYIKARDAMQTLIDLTNGSDDTAILAGMVEGMVANHRHLQSEGIQLLVRALGEYGHLPERQFVDPRNAFVHKLCATMRERLRDEMFWKDD